VSPPELTETTIRYLFATAWLPCDTSQQVVAVPGGSTTAIDTGGNLLHIAMWNLRRRGLMEFEQLRPVERERVRVLGGRPFSGHTLVDPEARLPGLEGALLEAARAAAPGDVRALVRALDLDNRGPWNTVTGHCFPRLIGHDDLLEQAALDPHEPRRRSLVVESLRERNDELRAARGAYLDAEPDLTFAVMSDCLRTVTDAYNPGLGG